MGVEIHGDVARAVGGGRSNLAAHLAVPFAGDRHLGLEALLGEFLQINIIQSQLKVAGDVGLER